VVADHRRTVTDRPRMLATAHRTTPKTRWHEVFAGPGVPRPRYAALVSHLLELPAPARRALREQMDATLREMGVAFNFARGDRPQAPPWNCDLLPHIFEALEWDHIERGFRQRLRAWEAFLEDVYGDRAILRQGIVPVHAVLASPSYLNPAKGLPRPRGAFLHLCGLCLARDATGTFMVKQHSFGHAEGISYMVQNRRALASVVPELFAGFPVQSLAESAVLLLEQFRAAAHATAEEPRVVLLSPGESGSTTPQLSFLARRMGVAMVQGGDLIVLDDRAYLKTVGGLERVDVIYNSVPDEQLDPLVFRRDSRDGVAGLVQCLRKGTLAVVNAVGSQLADDASLLPFAPQIIRFYLGEAPILPSMPTLWLGDLDQRELAISSPDVWRIRRIARDTNDPRHAHPTERGGAVESAFIEQVRREPGRYVAQPRLAEAATLCFSKSRPRECQGDHIVFAVRSGADFTVLPGALTRLHDSPAATEANETNSKDTWVLADGVSTPAARRQARRSGEFTPPPRQVMSRVADSFYWMGRYLERAYHQAYLISVIETLETEELNSAERKHYRPIWNRLLPPIERTAGTSRRSITTRLDRYRLVLLPQPGSVMRTFQRAVANAEAMRDSISPEAWATLTDLQAGFRTSRFRNGLSEIEAVRVTRRISEMVTRLIPQFFAIASYTMLGDDGWRFCGTGQMLERAIITGNSVVSIGGSLAGTARSDPLQAEEIELSALLRLLGTRDAYRRIYQTRAEPIHVLELLWQHPEAPRSIRRCLDLCSDSLRPAIAREGDDMGALTAIEEVKHRILRVDWTALVPSRHEDDELATAKDGSSASPSSELPKVQGQLLTAVLGVHTHLADSFLNHQRRIADTVQPRLRGI
jgi:uncharacterized circularly permuted ATP-grasp superfamily protein/uncharacterized alpha-E superfamily protein